jgi:hypothetical protein
MFRRTISTLVALVVVLATAMPGGLYAMPMPPSGMDADQPCQNCPQPDQSGNTNPDKMPVCQVLMCVGAMAVLPTPTMAQARAEFRVAYAQAPAARWTEAAPAPDPFPPRPIVLS